MWSRLTEYAAEIVAPPSDDGDHEGDARVGDELWSRFTNIVAPPGGESATTDDVGDAELEDDQERYISELERALLQKKKQNEVLEQRIRELEANGSGENVQRENETAVTTQEKDNHIARLEKELEVLKHNAKETAAKTAQDASARSEEASKLLRRVSELEVQCGVLQATLREERAVKTEGDGASVDTANTPTTVPSIFPTLVQAALTLAKSCSLTTHRPSFEVGTTDEAIATQLLELAESTRQRIEQSEAQVAKLHAALVSFFKMQKVDVTGDSDAFHGDVQSKLGVISHRLAKGESDAREVDSLQQQVKALMERDDKFQKTISALQTQLSGVQASKLKNDASLATRENEILAEVDKRDKTIANLRASEEQLKHAFEQLGKELEEAHSEADELEKVCRAQQQELKKLERISGQASALEEANEVLKARVQDLEKSAQEYEQGYLELLQEAETVKKQTEEEKAQLVATTEAQVISSEQQQLYEMQARLTACEADRLVAMQDADRLQNELDALDKVLLQFRADHKQQRERLLQVEQELEDAKRSSQINGGSSSNQGAISEEDFRRVMEVLSKRTQECDQLREALENVAKRFSSETVLDKQLAAQLVVSYLESDKKDEVLQLMARMMGFSEEQKLRAGILGDGQVVIPGNGGGGLFSSIFGVQSTSDASAAQGTDTQGKNVNELWTNLLVDEAKR